MQCGCRFCLIVRLGSVVHSISEHEVFGREKLKWVVIDYLLRPTLDDLYRIYCTLSGE